jgi:hypothetical protein
MGPCGLERAKLGHGTPARRWPGRASNSGGEALRCGHYDREEAAASLICGSGAPDAHRKGVGSDALIRAVGVGVVGGKGPLVANNWLSGVLQFHTKREKLDPQVN